MKKIVVTGGGSGGHVSAATGFIDKLLEINPEYYKNIIYIGGKLITETGRSGKSVEETRFENAKFKFISIRGGKLQRAFSFKSIPLLFGIIGGFIDSWKILSTNKPDFIFSTGGFVSLPVCIVGWLKKIPVFIHEQTAGVGLTNKIAGKFAKKIFLTFPDSTKYFDHKKVVHTGNLIRKSIWEINSESEIAKAIKQMQLEREKFPIIYISGGGQGTHLFNLLARQVIQYILLDFQIILQTGDYSLYKDYDVLFKEKLKLPTELQSRFYPVKFVADSEIGYVFKYTDIYFGRAGANIVYEMGLMKKPSILVPIPWVTNDEQNKNAKILIDCGIGKIVPEGELTAEKFHQELLKFKKDLKEGKYKPNSNLLDEIFKKDADEIIISELKNFIEI